jgi:nitrogen regulatory protein P-II 1
MKKIEAIIRPSRLEAVKDALHAMGLSAMTVSGVEGCGRPSTRTQTYRGSRYAVDVVSEVRLDVVATDTAVWDIVDTIQQAAKTGARDDGKIFVTDVVEVVRIRTGEVGEVAI